MLEQRKSKTLKDFNNLILLVFAYACLMSSTTLVVGTCAVVILSFDENKDYTNIAPMTLASFSIGTAFISLVTTSFVFKNGRKMGFLIGSCLGMTGAFLGAISIWKKSVPLLMCSYVPLGAANGIGNYIRFAAVEVVPKGSEALAVTLVLCGGVISAFVGPEAAQATKYLFGDYYLYLGIYLMIAIFNICMAALVSLTTFPEENKHTKEESTSSTGNISRNKETDESLDAVKIKETNLDSSYGSMIMSREFWVPAILSALFWGIMFMPMSIVRIAMRDAGYTSRQSLTVIEIHFVGMFGPGFFSGKMIKRFGSMLTIWFAFILFIFGLIFNIFSQTLESGGNMYMFAIGLFLLGAGWNFGFPASTLLLTKVYASDMKMKSKIQSSHDFIMFVLAGIIVVTAGYIYDSQNQNTNSGCDELCGWKGVNFATLGYTLILLCIIIFEYLSQYNERKSMNRADTKIEKPTSEEIDC